MKVEEFIAINALDDMINFWLKVNKGKIEVIDIKYARCEGPVGKPMSSALVLYKDKE